MSPMSGPSNTAVRCCSCRPTPTMPDRFERVRTALLAARLTRAPAGSRRQGGHRLERAGDHRAGRGRRCTGSTRIPRSPQRNARAAIVDLHRRGRPAAPGQPRRPGRRQRGDPGGSRGAGHRAADAAPAHRRGVLAGRRHRHCSTSRWSISPTRRRAGRWFDTADDAEQLMVRPADPLDGATPSGASSIAEALQLAAPPGSRAPRRQLRRGGRRPRWPARRRSWRGCRARADIGWPSPKPRCAGPFRSRWPATRRDRSCWPPPARWRRAGPSSSAVR